jgi:ABC-2 type transport system ATP-binding protein
MDCELVLQISKLNKKYKSFALQDVTLELPRGSIMGFVGPNGAGKSTTIKSILNIIPFNSGEILIDGMDNKRDEIKVKQIVGYVSEYLNFYGEVSASQFYKFVSQFYINWDDELFQRLIKAFGVDLTKKIGALSKGTVVKFAISLALSHHPNLLILDEPTSGLDPVVRNDVLKLLQDIVTNEQTSIFFSSHITEDIVKIADYVTYVNNGKILLSDKKENLLRNFSKVTFSEEIPEHMRSHLQLYRNKTAIVKSGNGLNYINSVGLKENQLERSAASLDEVLLLLIEETTNDA